mmetsp:Transcript_75064/g.195287  ORF Transcript_75064/g.195287 Transcript_75064/m.195287 type:complete len:270 (-) Transcript_75064:122-931(-)
MWCHTMGHRLPRHALASGPFGATRPAGLRFAVLFALAVAFAQLPSLCWLPEWRSPAAAEVPGRRATLAILLASTAAALEVPATLPADAFPNGLKEVKGPKQPGFLPSGVGTGGPLAGCKPSPNCFSSAPGTDEAHFLKPWQFSSKSSDAFADLERVVRAYPPGQRGVDGGGFEIQRSDPQTGYLYVQFESLKKGYIDDVEFIVRSDGSTGGTGGEVLVRSASRLGYLDLGVNAKRLNKIAEDLQALPSGGWVAPKITGERFPKYVEENR